MDHVFDANHKLHVMANIGDSQIVKTNQHKTPSFMKDYFMQMAWCCMEAKIHTLVGTIYLASAISNLIHGFAKAQQDKLEAFKCMT